MDSVTFFIICEIKQDVTELYIFNFKWFHTMPFYTVTPIDISRCWVYSFERLYLAFFRPLSAVISSVNTMATFSCYSVRFGHSWILHLFAFWNSEVALAVCVVSLSVCNMKPRSNLYHLAYVKREYRFIHLRIHPVTSVGSDIFSKHQWAQSFGSHASPMFQAGHVSNVGEAVKHSSFFSSKNPEYGRLF